MKLLTERKVKREEGACFAQVVVQLCSKGKKIV